MYIYKWVFTMKNTYYRNIRVYYILCTYSYDIITNQIKITLVLNNKLNLLLYIIVMNEMKSNFQYEQRYYPIVFSCYITKV